jgi:NAD(P)-dependent dehydrogenase (short-subunit alcohol dehydrogenase family)
MLTVAVAERLAGSRVTVNVCHPGDVESTLSRNLGFGGHETAEQAARTPVWLATEPIGARVSGRYFEHQREVSCRFGAERGAAEALYRICQGYS